MNVHGASFDWLHLNWHLIIKNAIWSNISPEKFKDTYTLRMRLIQPPENLL